MSFILSISGYRPYTTQKRGLAEKCEVNKRLLERSIFINHVGIKNGGQEVLSKREQMGRGEKLCSVGKYWIRRQNGVESVSFREPRPNKSTGLCWATVYRAGLVFCSLISRTASRDAPRKNSKTGKRKEDDGLHHGASVI